MKLQAGALRRHMQDFRDKVAVITGAASGIGLGMARTFAQNGMHVAMCDIQEEPLADAVKDVGQFGTRVLGVPLDVSNAGAVEDAATRIDAHFGRIHILCNNAGVLIYPKPVSDVSLDEWHWIAGVNLFGVIHGVRSFLPHIRRHGEGGHIVNTSSIGGFQVNRGRQTAAYATTKFAVLAFTEGLSHDLEDTNIGVSVLAPGAVNTNIYHAPRIKPERFGGPEGGPDRTPAELKAGMHPDQVGRRVLEAIRNRDFHVFTHMETRDYLLARHARIIEGYDSTAKWCADEGLGNGD